MKHSTLLNTLRHVAIFLAVVGLIGAAHSVFAQKKGQGPERPVIVFAPTYSCDSDFTGDYLTDIVFLNSTTAMWTIHDSNYTMSYVTMGTPNGQQVAADYDGDGIIDLASVYTQDGVMTWQILQSSNAVQVEIVWGIEGDTLAKGDYDGDGKADVAVRRPSDGFWYINGSLAGPTTIECGLGSDVAVPGDYDGDGLTDAAVFRVSERSFYYFGSLDQTLHELTWNGPLTERGNTFVPADYDGDGRTDLAIYNALDGGWSILESSTGEYRVEVFYVGPVQCETTPPTPVPCGGGDFAIPGDYDNDGKADPAVWNSIYSNVRAISSSNGPLKLRTEATSGMLPISAYFMTK